MPVASPPKAKSKPNDPAQFKRFLKTAKEVEVDPDPKALEFAVKKIVPSIQRKNS